MTAFDEPENSSDSSCDLRELTLSGSEPWCQNASELLLCRINSRCLQRAACLQSTSAPNPAIRGTLGSIIVLSSVFILHAIAYDRQRTRLSSSVPYPILIDSGTECDEPRGSACSRTPGIASCLVRALAGAEPHSLSGPVSGAGSSAESSSRSLSRSLLGGRLPFRAG